MSATTACSPARGIPLRGGRALRHLLARRWIIERSQVIEVTGVGMQRNLAVAEPVCHALAQRPPFGPLCHPTRYARSFYGVIALLAVRPTCLAVRVPGLHALIDVRVLQLLRLLRMFRILKLGGQVAEFGISLRCHLSQHQPFRRHRSD